MSKLETAPFKTLLDPRTNLNFDANRVSNIICPRIWTNDFISLYFYKQNNFLVILEASILIFTPQKTHDNHDGFPLSLL